MDSSAATSSDFVVVMTVVPIQSGFAVAPNPLSSPGNRAYAHNGSPTTRDDARDCKEVRRRHCAANGKSSPLRRGITAQQTRRRHFESAPATTKEML